MAKRPKRSSARSKTGQQSLTVKGNRPPAGTKPRRAPRPVEVYWEGLGELPKFYLNNLYRAGCALAYLILSARLTHFALLAIDPLSFGFTKVVMYASVSLLESFNILGVLRLSAGELLRRDPS